MIPYALHSRAMNVIDSINHTVSPQYRLLIKTYLILNTTMMEHYHTLLDDEGEVD